MIAGKSRSQDDDSVEEDKAQRRPKKVSSICINLPAAGLGQRPPSIHSSITTDEGGFNEPSPEIKALKTVYDYDNKKELISSHPDVISNVTYVDLEHRVQPEGIESDQLYDESESYKRKLENGSEAIKEKVVYATIKPELPVLLVHEKENILDEDGEYDVRISHDVTDRGYVSPQKILDPTCTRLHEDKDIEELFNKKLPPEPLSETETEEEEEEPLPMLPAKKIPPPIPELQSPLDLQDVEFADASDAEDEVNTRKLSDDNDHDSTIPDAMTHDEAERLLSSR
jgi:neurabin